MMNKKKFDFNEEDADRFVEDLRKNPKLSGYDINKFNANLYYMMLKSEEHCSSCKGLHECKNSIKGFTCYVDTKSNTLKARACKYKEAEEAFLKDSRFFKTLFEPENVMKSTLEGFTLSNDSRKRAYNKAVNFITSMKNNKNSEGVIFYGDFGVGKTYLLSAIANELSKNGINVILAYYPDLVREIKNSLNNPEKLESTIKQLKEVDVLMLDDLGSENLTAWLRDEIFGPIINYRAQASLPVCISTNYKGEELLRHFATVYDTTDTVKATRIMQRIMSCAGKFTKIEK